MSDQDLEKGTAEVAHMISGQCEPAQAFQFVEHVAARLSAFFEDKAKEADG